MNEPTPFDVCGELPSGTTLLEASAGTGKTWTIAALVTRYVAEGIAELDELLVVTFGRAASQELRERVRAQLVEAERVFAEPPGAGDPDPGPLLALLLDADAEERRLRRARLREALTRFDAATIATTHQFCNMVLGSLGVAGDTDAHARLVEDLDDLTVEVVDDLYLRAFAHSKPQFSRDTALAVARAAVGDDQATLLPDDAPPGSVPARRVSFAKAVRAEIARRKRRLGVLSYDDLLSLLADALEDEDSPARVRMRQRWRIVLVDEFQDTDPVQWDVLDRAFTGHATMVLIGDPKQAIYAFRGGDVVTYLKAARTATTQQTLAKNWRSDAPLVEATGHLLRNARLGDERIVVRDVAAHHPHGRLHGAPRPEPVRARVLRREHFGKGPGSPLLAPEVRRHVARDLALDIADLLASGATFDGVALRPQDVAVIAHRHADLANAQETLAEVGVPAVIAGGGSVFATPAAAEWLELLEGLAEPHRSRRVRTAALTAFLGYDAAGLDAGGDDRTDEIARRLRDWSEVFARRGVAAVLELATAGGMSARLLAEVGGERRLTDLRHIGEVLHEVSLTDQLGLAAMTTWLREQIAEAAAGGATERTRRLDSDAAAVQLVTIHASKGLEYPIVYLPTLADRFVRDPELLLFHDETGDRCLDVGAAGPHWEDHAQRHRDEDSGESLRLLYVAMTRAKSQVVTWWAPMKNAQASALHRLLFGRAPGGAEVPANAPVRPDPDVVEAFRVWRDAGALSPEVSEHIAPRQVELEGVSGELRARAFGRAVDTSWRRTSYTSLTSVAEAPTVSVGSEPEDPGEAEEEALPVDEDAAEAEAVAVDREADAPGTVSPMATLPVGATFGSLVHAVLEYADPAAPEHGGDLAAELRAHLREQRVRWPVEVDEDTLVEALVQVCRSPLGPLTPGRTLADIGLGDRLRELEFELPLVGGDDRDYPTEPVRLGDVATLLRRHLPADDPIRPYADTLDDPLLGGQDLRGYLTGSIDVALRVNDADGQASYLVVDYKTNWLGGFGDDDVLTVDRYAPASLAAAMTHSDYPLQALLYSVVLHRFLRWRLPGYDPARHLGGVLYLYLRGMAGPDTPVTDDGPCGVFSWRPPVALVEELSALLDGVPAHQPVGGAR